MLENVQNGDAPTKSRSDRGHLFTPREIEVLSWIAKGKSDWQVGQILLISAKTVNYHVERTKQKLRVATRMQAVLAAIEAGLLEASNPQFVPVNYPHP